LKTDQNLLAYNVIKKPRMFEFERRREPACAWNVLGNGVLLGELRRDLLLRLRREDESS
jgi:hypothetical protein